MSEMKALRKEKWINFEDVGFQDRTPAHALLRA
jgi:hypothetical protein